jgi:ribosome biogenesis GTPase
VRASDSRGRHATTRRQLFVLPGGALLIDTPGMRELQLWSDESALAGAFPDIEELAAGCRFRDCRHDAEPDCAVRAAVGRGALDPARLESWHKLQRELRWLAGKQDVRIRLEEQARWRMIQKSLSQHPKYRDRR